MLKRQCRIARAPLTEPRAFMTACIFTANLAQTKKLEIGILFSHAFAALNLKSRYSEPSSLPAVLLCIQRN